MGGFRPAEQGARLCGTVGWCPELQTEGFPTLRTPFLRHFSRKFCLLSLRPESTSSALPWDPLKDTLPVLCACRGSRRPPCADRSELRLMPEAGPRLARHCPVCGRDAKDICGPAPGRREFTGPFFSGDGAGWRTF